MALRWTGGRTAIGTGVAAAIACIACGRSPLDDLAPFPGEDAGAFAVPENSGDAATGGADETDGDSETDASVDAGGMRGKAGPDAGSTSPHDGGVEPLDAGVAPIDSGPRCMSVCSVGASMCQGDAIALCGIDDSGCLAWATPAPCPGGATCQSSAGAASCVPVAAPRAIAPLSTAKVTSKKPTLHWQLATGNDGAEVEICRDRACTMQVALFDAEGTSSPPPRRLAAGTYYWRLRGLAGAVVGEAASPVWQFTVGERSAPVDTSWGATTDLNGDGFDDVLAGTPSTNSLAGSIQIDYGSANGPAATPVSIAAPDGNGPFSEFGIHVAAAGDVNGDGYADLIVGADGGGASTGAAYVLLGGPNGLSSSATALAGPAKHLYFGWSVAGAGDLNGDGYADVAVAAEGASEPFAVYLGGPGGIATTPVTIEAPGIPQSVASAGDVNGDGFGDLLVGAFGVNHDAGAFYLYLGSAAGLSSSPIEVDGPAGAYGFFAQSIAGGADVNGDGFADVIVGSPGETPATYVYLGGATGLGASPTVLAAPAGPYDDLTIPYPAEFGGTVASAGDVNGDGFDDVIVGDPGFVSYEGAVYLYAGGPRGLSTTPIALALPPLADAEFGGCIAGAGDVNGDGFDDVVVGAMDIGYTRDPGFLSVVFGTSRGPSATSTGLHSPGEVMSVAE
jgi:hypothetical protein